MRFRYLIFFWLPLALLVLIVGLAVVSIQRDPAAVTAASLSNDQAQQAKILIQRYHAQLFGSEPGPVVIRATEDDLNTLLAFATRVSDRLSGESRVGDDSIALGLTLRLPQTPLGRYANFRARVIERDGDLFMATLSIGRLPVPGIVARPLANFIARSAFNILLGNGRGSEILDAFTAAEIEAGRAAVTYNPDPELMLALKDAAIAQVRSRVVVADSSRIRHYQERIDAETGSQSGRPLAEAMAPVFTLAAERSADGDPVAENRAAILALAIRYGDPRLARLAGSNIAQAPSDQPNIPVLAGREDLARHFLVSAALALSGRGVAGVIGEAKEMLDTGAGGSGFSFSDLAADRAGVRFAAVATSDDQTARRIQAMFSTGNLEEGAFFPSIAGLPDNLSDDEFRRRFGDVNSVAYRNMVADIDRRIDALEAYQQ